MTGMGLVDMEKEGRFGGFRSIIYVHLLLGPVIRRTGLSIDLDDRLGGGFIFTPGLKRNGWYKGMVATKEGKEK